MATIAASAAVNVVGLGSSALKQAPKSTKKHAVGVSSLSLRSSGLRQPNSLGSAYMRGAAVVADSSLGAVPPRFTMAAQAYICRDCGYIYDARQAFEKVSDDYRCPVCQAPKRRFKPYTKPVAKNANDLSVRKARKEENKESGNPLPVVIGAILAGLVGTFFYLNSQL
eukprot:jgi/Mesen1/425/ME000100S10662